MSDNVIQFRPRPNPDRMKQLERDAQSIMALALLGDDKFEGVPVVPPLSDPA